MEHGWRVVFETKNNHNEEDENEKDEEGILPEFVIGESGGHNPALSEKWTQPPKFYTEATLLRAMETAGKLVEDEELRDALKENGIGRPSTRANIIETLFKRNYIRKERKNLYATQTGVQLIQTIQYDLLKSAELTGIWEKKLRQIESNQYDTKAFLNELKQMVNDIVLRVKSEWGKTITIEQPKTEQKAEAQKEAKAKEQKPRKKREKKDSSAPSAATTQTDEVKKTIADSQSIPEICPLCGKGRVIKGKTAYGCSEWRMGCTFRLPLEE